MFNLTNKNAVGIDIADRTIEIAELEKNGNDIQILNLGRVVFPAGIVEWGRIKDEKKLIEIITKVFKTAKPSPIEIERKVIYSLPESVVFNFHINLKNEDKKNKEAFILEEVKKNIPLLEKDLIYDYRTINKNKEGEDILIVVVERQVVEEWKEFFKKMKMEIGYFDVEILASFRGLMSQPAKEPVCLVDIGTASTHIAIFDKKGLQHSFLIPEAGESFSLDLSNQLKIDLINAETKKKQIDLNKKDRYSKVLLKSLEPISNEIKEAVDFFQKRTKQKIKKIILIGGSSKIKGLAEYFKINLKIETTIGSPVLKKAKTKRIHLNAIGSALRDIDKVWENDPIIEITDLVEEEKKLPKDNKKRNQIIFLISLLIMGIILILLALWFRDQERLKVQEIRQVVLFDTYQDTQILNLKIPVAVDTTEYTEDRLQARLIEEIIKGAGGEANSKIKAEQRLKEGERLWPIALNKIYLKEDQAFIDTYRWMAYPVKEAVNFFLREVDKNNIDDVKYILNGIQETSLEATDNPDIFIMGAEVNVSFERVKTDFNIPTPLVEIATTTENKIITEEIEETKTMVLISETGTGWLNVRRGPSTQYASFTTVNPGEEYELVEEEDYWVKIKISDVEAGWVYREYVEVRL